MVLVPPATVLTVFRSDIRDMVTFWLLTYTTERM